MQPSPAEARSSSRAPPEFAAAAARAVRLGSGPLSLHHSLDRQHGKLQQALTATMLAPPPRPPPGPRPERPTRAPRLVPLGARTGRSTARDPPADRRAARED